MAYTLYTGEMICALRDVAPLKAEIYEKMYVHLNELIALDLADSTTVDSIIDSRMEDGRLAASFQPSTKGQTIPEALKGWDEESEWDDGGEWSCENCGETAMDGSGECITCGQPDEEAE